MSRHMFEASKVLNIGVIATCKKCGKDFGRSYSVIKGTHKMSQNIIIIPNYKYNIQHSIKCIIDDNDYKMRELLK